MRQLKLTLLALAAFAASGFFANAAWINLFNGKDLSGWTQKTGEAKYFVQDGCIVGQAAPGSKTNSFLCATKDYGNFLLELDFKCDPALNSGVQFRSEFAAQPRSIEWQGKTIHVPAGYVFGYQCEIDADAARRRMWTAGIYDERRRLWLFPADGEHGPQGTEFSRQGNEIFNTNDWNHLRIEAVGGSIKTYLNNVLCAHINDSLTPKGLIGLQVHQIGDDKAKSGAQVRFKNIRLEEVSPKSAEAEPTPNMLTEKETKAGWRLLWDGKTTDGWRCARSEDFPKKSWKIADDMISVVSSGNAEAQSGGDIITRERFSNFELIADFKTTPGCNSGIKYWVQPNVAPVTGTGTKAAVGSAIGYEYQVLDDLRHPDAKLGRDGDRKLGSLYDLLPASSDKKVNPIGEWNTARIIVHGNRVEHWLNGERILKYDRDSKIFKDAFEQSKFRNIPGYATWTEGHILLQEHGSAVSFRNIKILVLPAK